MSEKEDGHLTFLKKNFNLDGKEVHDLDVSDIYDEQDPELANILRKKLAHYFSDLS